MGVIDVPVVRPGGVLVVVDEAAGAGVMAGTIGTDPTLPTVGNGTAAAELTPRLPISTDPNGSPVRAAPPGVVDDVDIGVDDEAVLVEPEPHASESPGVPDIAAAPDVAAIAGIAVPTTIPPPS
jgi:hypothetical protein